ncbi:unnamed protein product [Bursaphelenchus xylophilus]|uniref:(pine wood nematode) hypothetical protein n=1 Tax=Bursaphelenchus xylophilus TaxID=6326 RepID=A0A1I7RR93_BURXY|nr:unnamed protein product [Bursaphelenchus xylophilus]CAG9130881.1 unnamed protein product [Bursaphelenchus xylophilus]
MFNYDNYYGSYQNGYLPSTSYVPHSSVYSFDGYPVYGGHEYHNQNFDNNPFFSNFKFQMPGTEAELDDAAEMIDMTDEETEKSKRSYPYNPYSSLLESNDGAPNRLMMMVFNARITSKDKPAGCSRPQNPDGTFNKAVLPVIEKMLNNQLSSQQEARPVYKLINLGANDNIQEPVRGYLVNNGNTWVRRKEAEAPKVSPPKKKFGNLSLVNVGGKKITGDSNECIGYAKDQKCLADSLCKYSHNASSEHQKKLLCSSQMKGMCRNGKKCDLGYHLLQSHQLPVCHYYLKMMCSEEDCPYLHVKHSPSTDLCSLFQKGLCTLGIRCNYIHRYSVIVLAQRTDPKLEFGPDGDQVDPQPLAQWFF